MTQLPTNPDAFPSPAKWGDTDSYLLGCRREKWTTHGKPLEFRLLLDIVRLKPNIEITFGVETLIKREQR